MNGTTPRRPPHRGISHLPGANRKREVQTPRRPPETSIPVTERQSSLLEEGQPPVAPNTQTISAGVCANKREVPLHVLEQISNIRVNLCFCFFFCFFLCHPLCFLVLCHKPLLRRHPLRSRQTKHVPFCA
jgi:hypothetical protein